MGAVGVVRRGRASRSVARAAAAGTRRHQRRGRVLPRLRTGRHRVPGPAAPGRLRGRDQHGQPQARLRGPRGPALVPGQGRRRQRAPLPAARDRPQPGDADHRGDPGRRRGREQAVGPLGHRPPSARSGGPLRAPGGVRAARRTRRHRRAGRGRAGDAGDRARRVGRGSGRVVAVARAPAEPGLDPRRLLRARPDRGGPVVAGQRDGRRHPRLEQLHPDRPGRDARPGRHRPAVDRAWRRPDRLRVRRRGPDAAGLRDLGDPQQSRGRWRLPGHGPGPARPRARRPGTGRRPATRRSTPSLA